MLNLAYGTDIIANALAAYGEDSSQNKMTHLLSALYTIMAEGGNILIPTAKGSDEGNVLLVTQRLAGGKEYVVAFTSQERLQGQNYDIMEAPLVNYFAATLEMEGIAGIIFNILDPNPITVEKKLIQGLMAEYAPHPWQNKFYVERRQVSEISCNMLVHSCDDNYQGNLKVLAKAGTTPAELLNTFGPYKEPFVSLAGALEAPYLLHAVCPCYTGEDAEGNELVTLYHKIFDIAANHHCHSIALPVLGLNEGFPLDIAAPLACGAAASWLSDHETYGLTIVFTCSNSPVYNAMQQVVKVAQGNVK